MVQEPKKHLKELFSKYMSNDEAEEAVKLWMEDKKKLDAELNAEQERSEKDDEDVVIPPSWIESMEKTRKSHLVSVAVAVDLMDAMLATERFSDDEAKNMALLFLDKAVNGG